MELRPQKKVKIGAGGKHMLMPPKGYSKLVQSLPLHSNSNSNKYISLLEEKMSKDQSIPNIKVYYFIHPMIQFSIMRCTPRSGNTSDHHTLHTLPISLYIYIYMRVCVKVKSSGDFTNKSSV